ncbi:hypothetical protein [Myxococcus sp. AB036A]|uniref:hypothetical protein n=1 Tax=Myxococcus sp. AB036A TaxID=2562793 RepID=UPI001146F7E2|nr:hypothetical protein [Myxococcus sp. AB036A]
MHRSTRLAGVCLVVATLLTLAGCSSSLRKNYVRDKAANHVYRQELAQLWPHVQEVLRGHGYSWKEMPGRYVLETEWLDSGGGSLGPGTASRFLVQGIVLTGGGTALRVMRGDRVTQSIGVGYVDKEIKTDEDYAQAVHDSQASGVLPTRQNYFRDLEIELEILRRSDPEAAARFDADALAAHP